MIGYIVLNFTEYRQTEYYLFLFADDSHHLTPFTMTESYCETYVERKANRRPPL